MAADQEPTPTAPAADDAAELEPTASGLAVDGRPAPVPWLIREQIERLAGHPTLSRSPTSVKLLRFFSDNILDRGGRPVTQRDVASVLLGLATGFQPTLNPLVRMQVVRLRRKLLDYYAGDGATDAVLITLPKGTYRLACKWNPAAAMEPGPAGLGVAPAAAHDNPAEPPGSGPNGRSIVLVAELAVDGLAPDWDGLGGSVAAHLVPGLLGHGRLFAIGPLHRRRAALEAVTPRAARGQYQADFLLEGELARDGDAFIATLRLLGPASDVPVWTDWCREQLDAIPRPAPDSAPGSERRPPLLDAVGELLAGRISRLLKDAFPS